MSETYSIIFESFKARENFGENKKIDLKEFRKAPIQKVYQSLFGITSVKDPTDLTFKTTVRLKYDETHSDKRFSENEAIPPSCVETPTQRPLNAYEMNT